MTDTPPATAPVILTPRDVPPKSWLEFWWRLIPDSKAIVFAAVFVLVLALLQMIHKRPELLDSASFMQLVQAIIGAGGFGLIIAWHFASSSGTAKANERADKAERRATDATGDLTGRST